MNQKKPQRIGFIGGGNIAEALIRGIITSGYLDPGHISVADIFAERLLKLNRILGVRMVENNKELASQSDVLFLAVKPSQVLQVAEEVKDALNGQTCVISIAAGKSLKSIKASLNNYPKACRIMPNLAASVRKSSIALYVDNDFNTQDLTHIHSLLSVHGKVFLIEDEKLMAPITALSGSAPAYYVMMADALIDFGVSQGMDRELATDLILSTMEGAAVWASNSDLPLSDLWHKVVTRGGTTEAGINYYSDKGFIDIFVEGLRRVTTRAREIGDE